MQRLIQSGVNRFVLDLPPTPAVAVAGIAFLTRAWGTIIALFVAQHVWGSEVAVPAAILFAVLYTIDAMARGLAWAELQARAARRDGVMPPPLRAAPARWPWRSRVPAQALAADEPKTDPTKEFLLEPWIEIPKIGPIDLSITKAVFYLLLSTAILLDRHAARGPAPAACTRRSLQAFVEIVYDFSETQIGRASLPAKTYTTWFPYLATLFLFIWINNMISYLPLPVDTEHKIWGWLPTPSFYAATSNLSVTLALTLVTFFASHYVGIQHNGARGLLQELVPADLGPDQAS